MNILFLTSSTSEKVFNELCEFSDVKPNPSNQNFYHRLIHSLAMYNDVSVISHRPSVNARGKVNTGRYYDEEEQVKYYYTSSKPSKLYKIFSEKNEIINVSYKTILNWPVREFIIIVDPLRRNLTKAALRLKRRFGVPCIGMLTDNPKNLSKQKLSLSNQIIKNTKDFDGFLALSDGLIKAYEASEKPHYIFEGLVEDIPEYRKEPIGEYFAFAGALYERYGVKNLVEAFGQVNTTNKLVIMGSGPLKNYINQKAEEDPRILYLSQIPKNRVFAIEQHAIANINPRIFNETLDAESVPSKVLEYISSGRPTISTMHSKLFSIFPNDIYWVKDDSINALKEAMELVLKEKNADRNLKALTAKNKVYDMYSVAVQGESITHFLKSFKTSNS